MRWPRQGSHRGREANRNTALRGGGGRVFLSCAFLLKWRDVYSYYQAQQSDRAPLSVSASIVLKCKPAPRKLITVSTEECRATAGACSTPKTKKASNLSKYIKQSDQIVITTRHRLDDGDASQGTFAPCSVWGSTPRRWTRWGWHIW
jgi:hypothetical protein